MDEGFHRLGPEKGLAEAAEPFIGVDFDPQNIGKFIEPERLNRRDFHGENERVG